MRKAVPLQSRLACKQKLAHECDVGNKNTLRYACYKNI